MTNRPRSHQIAEQARFALGRVLPSQWTVEQIVQDYGLDLRIEIFTGDGRPTGHFFFVQLKSTDRLPTRQGISVRIRPEHLGYWNRLPVPTMVVLWIAPADRLYWKWAHLHHPFPRRHTPKVESFRMAPSDRFNAGDPPHMLEEVVFCERARGGVLSTPIDVHFESHPSKDLGEAQRRQFMAAWLERVDSRSIRIANLPTVMQARVVLGRDSLRVRLGRATLSFAQLEEQRPLNLVSEAASALGLLLCNGGHTEIGLSLIAVHGAQSLLLAGACRESDGGERSNPLVNPAYTIAQAGRFDVAFELAETWLEQGDDELRGAAHSVLMTLKAFEARMSDEERARLHGHYVQDARLGRLLRPEVAFDLADLMFRVGRPARAIEQYTFAAGSEHVTEIEDHVLVRLVGAYQSVADYDQAVNSLTELVRRHPAEDHLRLRLGICLVLAGQYVQACLPLTSVTTPKLHGSAWAWAVTAVLASRAAGADAQARMPAAAEQVSRSLDHAAAPNDLIKLFRSAAGYDAVSANTWRIYWAAAFGNEEDLPFGRLGILPVAVLAEGDPEWWALTLSELLTARAFEPFLRGVECALEAVEGDFPTMLESDGPLSEWARPGVAHFVSSIAELKDDGHALRIRPDPVVIDGRTSIAIDLAPPGYRLFDFDVPPVDAWFAPDPTE